MLVVVLPLVFGLLQLGLVLHVRNTLTAAASEGARYAATVDRSPSAGVERTRSQVQQAVSGRFARQVVARPVTIDGVAGVEVEVRAEVPPLGLWGPAVPLRVFGHAVEELPP